MAPKSPPTVSVAGKLKEGKEEGEGIFLEVIDLNIDSYMKKTAYCEVNKAVTRKQPHHHREY